MRRLALLLLVCFLAAACSSGKPNAAGAGHSSPQAGNSAGDSEGSAGAAASGTVAPSRTRTPGVAGHVIRPPRKDHVRAVLNNGRVRPCSLVTSRQVNEIAATSMPVPQTVPVGTFDECATTQHLAQSSRKTPIHIAWAVPPVSDPALAFRQHTIRLPAADALQGLGSKADCGTVASPPSAQLFVLSKAGFLEVFADSCGRATALARVVLQQL